MQIKSSLTTKSGQVLTTEYIEGVDPAQKLDGKILQGVHAYCFYKDKLVVVYAGKKGTWGPPGGHIEDDETYEEVVTREVMEESNMKVIHQELIGFIDVYELDKTIRQTRSFCIVEPYGDFVADTDIEGDITEMKLIDPKDYKQYFDWGEVGDRMIKRALEMKEKLKFK